MRDEAQDTRARGSRLIVGLGNPGARYEGTRHNLGFEVVACLARRWHVSLATIECNALVGEAADAVLAASQTYMNRSGYAVRCLAQRRAFESEDMLVVFDDVDLSFGKMRLRKAGGPGGHRGMESVVQSLQTEKVPRLRLGVAPLERRVEEMDLVDFVLSPFTDTEAEDLPALVDRAADACESWLREGLETTMNRFNG